MTNKLREPLIDSYGVYEGLLWPLFNLPFYFVKKKTHLKRETKAKKVIIFSLFENMLYFTQIKRPPLLIFTPVLSSV